MSAIESKHNEKFKSWVALLDARGIKKQGLALLSGRKLVAEFLEQNPKRACDLLVRERFTDLPTGIRTHVLAAPLFQELDVLGTDAPLLVIEAPRLPEWKPSAPSGLELILPLSDPGNLGAILRSAEAFGVRRVVLTQEACSPYLPRALRAASGATFRIAIEATGPLSEVQSAGAYCLDMDGENLRTFKWPHDVQLILGEEGRGLPTDLRATRLTIPMSGRLESLNAMAAASIALFSYRGVWP